MSPFELGGLMKRLFWLLLLCVSLSACGWTDPKAGEQAVLTYQPMLFGHGGVDPEPVKPGLVYIAMTTVATIVNMQPQRIDLEFDDLMTSSGVPIGFHAVLSYQVIDSVRLVRDFGADWIDKQGPGFFVRNLDQPFRSAVRNSVKKRDMQDMAITATAAEAVDAEVTSAMNQLITSLNVPIRLVNLSLGRANPPDAIKHQRIETAAQEQRIITEQQRKLAEDQRKMAEESRASADAAYNNKMNLNPSQYLQLETIKMQRDVCVRGTCYFGFSPTWTQPVHQGTP